MTECTDTDKQLTEALTEMQTNVNYLMSQVRQAAARGASLEQLLDSVGPNVPELQRWFLAGVVVGASGLTL